MTDTLTTLFTWQWSYLYGFIIYQCEL